MNTTTFPTKGNLILAKNSLALAKQGYDLMDKKRSILIRELMSLIHQAKGIQSQINQTFSDAYLALQQVNIEMGIRRVYELSQTVKEERNVQIKVRSIMGTEIPHVEYESQHALPSYSFYNTRISLDIACQHFIKVKELIIQLSMIETSAYRLATNIKKTQKRANALRNITIPYYTALTKDIQNALEEKDREEFTRLKVVKQRKNKRIS